jgi:hypothetical protein
MKRCGIVRQGSAVKIEPFAGSLEHSSSHLIAMQRVNRKSPPGVAVTLKQGLGYGRRGVRSPRRLLFG